MVGGLRQLTCSEVAVGLAKATDLRWTQVYAMIDKRHTRPGEGLWMA